MSSVTLLRYFGEYVNIVNVKTMYIIHPEKNTVVLAVGSILCPFLEDHKEDILCGPVWLASGLDLSGHAGMLSLTSPKLVKGNNSHTFLWSHSVFPDRILCSERYQQYFKFVIV